MKQDGWGRRRHGLPRNFCRLLGLGCPKQAFAKIAALSPGYRYQKAGVQLDHFHPITKEKQMDLFALSDYDENRYNNVALMSAMDKINQRFPKAIMLGSTGLVTSTSLSAKNVSPHYTTCWHDLPQVKC
jgi:DNA polymerase V